MAGTEEAGMSFAERMMKNMGWSQGKGLGKEEGGIKDFIKPKMKFNTKGIGFMGVDNKWIAHQEHFDDLLTSLNKGEKPAEKKDIACLTSTSKLRGRTKFYAKMMRGKDLSNRSSQDLSAIIVPLSRKEEAEKVETAALPSEVSSTLKSSQVSMDDYFAKMMAQRKSKLNDKRGSGSNVEEGSRSDSGDREEEPAGEPEEDSKQKKKKKKKRDHELGELGLSFDREVVVEDPSGTQKKKRKSEKVDTVSCSDSSDRTPVEVDITEVDQEEQSIEPPKRKSKKTKTVAVVEVEVSDEEKVAKRTKKSSVLRSPEPSVEELSHETHTEDQVVKKKKKKNKCVGDHDALVNDKDQSVVSPAEDCSRESKKRKKSKSKGTDDELEISEDGRRLNIDVNLLQKIRGPKLGKSKAAPVRELTDVQIQEIHRMWTSGEYAEFMRKVHSGEFPRWVAVEESMVERMIMGRAKLLDLADVRELVQTKWKNANVEEIWGYTNVAYLAV